LKYVSRQYLDNTSDKALSLDPYLVNDARCSYLISPKNYPVIELTFHVNNILNTKYESNGYSYYDETSNTYYGSFYPQAGINFLAGLNIRF
jgi:iron complex outermembrane receptor protein